MYTYILVGSFTKLIFRIFYNHNKKKNMQILEVLDHVLVSVFLQLEIRNNLAMSYYKYRQQSGLYNDTFCIGYIESKMLGK